MTNPSAKTNEKTQQRKLVKELAVSWDTPSEFFALLARSFLGQNAPAVASALVTLQRHRGKNVLDIALQLSKTSPYFWSASRPLLLASARLADGPAEFVDVLNHFTMQAAGDMAAGEMTARAGDFCRRSTKHATAFLDHCSANPAELANFVPPGLVGMSERTFLKAHKRALAMCASPESSLRAAAIFALGLFDYTDHQKQRISSIEAFKNAAQDSEPSVLISTARATGLLLQKASDRDLEAVLVFLAQTADPAVLLWTANALVELMPQQAEPWFRQCLSGLTSIPIENVHDMGPLDRLLSDLLQNDPTAVLDFLSAWASKQEPCQEMFRCKSLRHALIGRPVDLQRFITHWFAADHPHCHQLAINLLSEVNHRITRDQQFSGLELDCTIISSCTVGDVEFIVRKVIGHGFVYPKEMASLVFSTLRRPRDRKMVEGIVRRYFRSVILYSFPGTTRPFLEAVIKKGTSRQQRIAQAILDDLQPYFDALAALPQLKEFSPSPIRLHKYQLAHNRQMQQSMKKTEDSGEFIFSKLAKKMPVKAGRAFFFKQRTGPNEDDVRLTDATPMQAISFSYEAPRQYSLDPVGCEYDLVIMRTETRKEVAGQ